MSQEIKKTLKTALWTALILLVALLIVKAIKYCHKAQEPPEPIYVTDTIVNVMFDTVYLDHYNVIKLPIHDTLNQIIIKDSLKIDSVFVEIPISAYKLDTAFATDTMEFRLSLKARGYDVSLDTLSYSFSYRPSSFDKKHRIGWFAGPSVGVGYDFCTGRLVPTIGVGVGLGITIKKF